MTEECWASQYDVIKYYAVCSILWLREEKKKINSPPKNNNNHNQPHFPIFLKCNFYSVTPKMARPHLKRDKRFNQSQQHSIISVCLIYKNNNFTRASTRPAPSSVCTWCQTSSYARPSYLNNPHLSLTPAQSSGCTGCWTSSGTHPSYLKNPHQSLSPARSWGCTQCWTFPAHI